MILGTNLLALSCSTKKHMFLRRLAHFFGTCAFYEIWQLGKDQKLAIYFLDTIPKNVHWVIQIHRFQTKVNDQSN